MYKTLLSMAFLFTLTTTGSAQPPKETVRDGAVIKAVGTLEPQEVVDVSSRVRGIIRRIPGGEYGAMVKKGDLLVELDSMQFQAEVSIAKAGLMEAEANYALLKAQMRLVEGDLDRARKQVTTGAITQADLDKFQGALDVARANMGVAEAKILRSKAMVERAMVDLDACHIRSPIDGIVIDRRVNVGQIVGETSNAPGLFLIGSDLRNLEVWTSVKESDITRVAVGQDASITIDAYPKEKFNGKVKQIRLNAAMAKGQVSYTVVISLENQEARLLPYLTAEVSIAAGERR